MLPKASEFGPFWLLRIGAGGKERPNWVARTLQKAQASPMQNLRIENAADLVPAPGCPFCRDTMHLAGIEWETEARDVYTFHCTACDHNEVKRVELH